MNTLMSKAALIAALLIATIVTGIVLSRIGRPLNTWVFTIHKLSALGAIVLLVINVNGLVRTVDVQTMTIGLIAATAVLFVAVVVSGAFLSFERPAPEFVLRVHQVVPLLALISAGGSLTFLLRGQA